MDASTRAPGLLSDVELDPGTVLAGYELVRVVSRTRGVNIVYEAIDTDGERVAIKLVSRALGQNRRFRDRFEPLLAKRSAIRHPHLLPLLDWGEFVDVEVPGTTCLYVVSEFVDSSTLSELLDERPPHPHTALRLLAQVADALDAAHAHGLVHPHLTPSDILVDEQNGGHALVTDFLGASVPGGSQSYRSPESARGEGLAPASDVYSLTLTLIECLTGEAPTEPVWSAAPSGAASHPLQEQDLPNGLDRVFATGMARDPADRYPTCAALVGAAAAALEGVEPSTLRALRDRAESSHRTRAADAQAPALAWPPQQQAWPGERRRLPTPRFALTALAIGAVLGLGVGAIADGGDESSSSGPSRSQLAEVGAAREQAALLRRATPPVNRLLAARAAGRRRLARARRPAGQAVVAASLGRTYAAAARQLERAGAQDLAATARRGANAYERLAAAARSGKVVRWRAATRVVRRVDSQLGRELRAFGGQAS